MYKYNCTVLSLMCLQKSNFQITLLNFAFALVNQVNQLSRPFKLPTDFQQKGKQNDCLTLFNFCLNTYLDVTHKGG